MQCARPSCSAPAQGPLSVAPNIHEMACSSCAAEWRRRLRAIEQFHIHPRQVLLAFRAFMSQRTT
jgi:hypothetical protein